MKRPTYCENCPARFGGTDCDCSREYTRELALWMWSRLCAFVRGLDLGDWLVIVVVLLAIGATVARH